MVRRGSAQWNKGACVQDTERDRFGAEQSMGPLYWTPSWLVLLEMSCPENGPFWSSMSCFRGVSGLRWGVTELEIDIFCNLDLDTHIYTTRELQPGCDYRGIKICDLRDRERDQQ